MSRNRTLAGVCSMLLGIGFMTAGCLLPAPAQAQYGYPCAPGYYYYPNYGCVPPGYFYGYPYYAYPDFGFDFFYGPGWGRRWGGYYGPGRGVPPRGWGFHGGPPGRAPHGGAPHGGGGHGGGHPGR
jgi:hypothetical protein